MKRIEAFWIRGGEIRYSEEHPSKGPGAVFSWEMSSLSPDALALLQLDLEVQTRDAGGTCWTAASKTTLHKGLLAKSVTGLKQIWRVRYQLAGPAWALAHVARPAPSWRACA